MDFTQLQAFRAALYLTFRRRATVLMDIIDALLTSAQARRAIEITLAPAFQQRWPSFYQGLQEGHIYRAGLRRVYCQFIPHTPGHRLVLALDTVSVLRLLSPTARDRMAVHAANLPDTAPPVGLGWQFSAVVVVPEVPSSWTYYLECTRISSGTTPARLGTAQLASLLPLLPARPVVLGDRYYGSAAFVLGTKDLKCDKLLRIQTHRVFYRQPPPPDPHQRGPHPKKGARFQPKDPATHGPPSATWTGTDARGRPVTVTAWTGLAFAEDLTHSCTILRCARQDGPDSKRDPRVIWLLWDSPDAAPLSEIPDLYTRRFSEDHGFRFDKQALLWEEPRLRTPAQFQRWTDLMVAAHNTLVVARPVVGGVRLPWERDTDRPLTPQQVRRAFPGIMATLGTPAPPPQPRGKSPGRAPGTVVRPAKRYAVVRKSAPAPPNVG